MSIYVACSFPCICRRDFLRRCLRGQKVALVRNVKGKSLSYDSTEANRLPLSEKSAMASEKSVAFASAQDSVSRRKGARKVHVRSIAYADRDPE